MLPPFDVHKLFKSLSWYYEYLRALARFLADWATNQIKTQPRLLTHICYDIILYSIDSPFLAASGCFPRADWPVLHVCSCCCHVFSCIFYADCIMPHANSVREGGEGERARCKCRQIRCKAIQVERSFNWFVRRALIVFPSLNMFSCCQRVKQRQVGGGRRGRKQLGTWLNVT